MGQAVQKSRLRVTPRPAGTITLLRQPGLAGCLVLALFVSLSLPLRTNGQDSGIPVENHLAQARALLQQLDTLAQSCLDSQESGSEDAGRNCSAFSQAIDGELLATYLSSCRLAKAWRDEFVLARAEGRQSDTQASAAGAALDSLVNVEYLCGENALLERTGQVAQAYRLLNNSDSRVLAQARSVQQQLDTLQQDALINAERRRLLESVSELEQHRQQQTTSQQRQLELEIIRQQSAPPLR